MTTSSLDTTLLWRDEVPVVSVSGTLDATTYLDLRNAIVKCATDGPPAVIVDIDRLAAPAPSAWAVLTSAAWHLRQWPNIPLAVVCSSSVTRKILRTNGIARYLPVVATTAEALDAVSGTLSYAGRLRARVRRPRETSPKHMRQWVAETLRNWGRPECVSAASIVATVLVENTAAHTDGDLDLRLEMRGEVLTIAAFDGEPAPAVLREAPDGSGLQLSGLALLAALSKSWGTTPTGDGKTVWAVLGPDEWLSLDRA